MIERNIYALTFLLFVALILCAGYAFARMHIKPAPQQKVDRDLPLLVDCMNGKAILVDGLEMTCKLKKVRA